MGLNKMNKCTRKSNIKQCYKGMHNIREWLIWTYVKSEMQLWQTRGSLFLIYVLLVVFHLSSLHLKNKRKDSCHMKWKQQMERIKNFRILTGVVPITMVSQASKIWKIYVRLTNLSPPLVKRA